MIVVRWTVIAAFLAWLCAPIAVQAVVGIDSAAARATLAALVKPDLTQAEALVVADVPANRQLLRKESSYGAPVTRAMFADELVAAARGDRKDGNFTSQVRARMRLARRPRSMRSIANRRAFRAGSSRAWRGSRQQDCL